jgi:hypothetical protein
VTWADGGVNDLLIAFVPGLGLLLVWWLTGRRAESHDTISPKVMDRLFNAAAHEKKITDLVETRPTYKPSAIDGPRSDYKRPVSR